MQLHLKIVTLKRCQWQENYNIETGREENGYEFLIY